MQFLLYQSLMLHHFRCSRLLQIYHDQLIWNVQQKIHGFWTETVRLKYQMLNHCSWPEFCLNASLWVGSYFWEKPNILLSIMSCRISGANSFTQYSTSPDQCCKKFWKRNWFLLLTVLCIVLGVCLGVVLSVFSVHDNVLLWIGEYMFSWCEIFSGLPGELFIRALNFSVVPLLASNIIASMLAIVYINFNWLN